MNKKKGTFVLSLDTELAWGSFDKGLSNRQIHDFLHTRQCITRLLALLEKYQISATFAMVGHLMLSKCHSQNGKKHPELIRPNHSWYQKDWFFEDPATDLHSDPIWYGEDILLKICQANPAHEIACHTFSHIIMGDKGCTQACAETDIAECVRVAEAHGLRLTSMVFPRDSEGHKDILRKYGFLAYRGAGNEWFKAIKNRTIRQACHYIDNIMGFSPKTSVPQIDEFGLYNIVGNMFYMSRSGIRRLIPVSMRVHKAKKGIDRAIKRGEVFHMWFHPFNLASDPDNLLNGLEEIFSYARVKIDNGELDNCTMYQVCQKYSSIIDTE